MFASHPCVSLSFALLRARLVRSVGRSVGRMPALGAVGRRKRRGRLHLVKRVDAHKALALLWGNLGVAGPVNNDGNHAGRARRDAF